MKHSPVFRAVTLGTMVVCAASCTTWQRQEPGSIRPLPAAMDSTRVTLRDGTRITLDSARVTADSVVGWRSGVEGETERSAFSWDQLQQLERRVLDYNAAGLVAVVGGMVGFVVWAITSISFS